MRNGELAMALAIAATAGGPNSIRSVSASDSTRRSANIRASSLVIESPATARCSLTAASIVPPPPLGMRDAIVSSICITPSEIADNA